MLRIAIQMDEPHLLNPASDSTIFLAREAQRRGHSLFCYVPVALSARGERILAHPAYPLQINASQEDWYHLGASCTLDLKADVDAVLMRQDPPFHMGYITTTYLLDQLAGHTYVSNNPTTVRSASEKLAILNFPEDIPPTLVTRDASMITAFRAEYRDLIVKPLYGYGGRSVYRFRYDDGNLLTFMEQSFGASPEPLMIQPFLPEVATEDKRVIMIDGEIACVVGRIPAAGEVRANMRVGGKAARAELNDRQQQICKRVGVWLKANDVLFAGLDLIGDYLTEINTTSPTCLKVAYDMYGINTAIAFWDALEARLSAGAAA